METGQSFPVPSIISSAVILHVLSGLATSASPDKLLELELLMSTLDLMSPTLGAGILIPGFYKHAW